jgi:hypothetical protein
MLKNVASARMNRTEGGERFVALGVAASCDPAGVKPAETFPAETNTAIPLVCYLRLEYRNERTRYGCSSHLSSEF